MAMSDIKMKYKKKTNIRHKTQDNALGPFL
jgi:hypothetical protein